VVETGVTEAGLHQGSKALGLSWPDRIGVVDYHQGYLTTWEDMFRLGLCYGSLAWC